MKRHNTQSRGFTPTPILALFRFLKILSLVVVTPVQEFISAKNISETKKSHQNWCRGFTLIELLVTMGLMMVMTGAVLANYRSFDTNAKFANASEDIVLALRQAQVYGVGTKGQGSSFTTPYGVYFDTTTPNQIIIFADRDSDGKYTAGDNPVIETINWGTAVISMSVSCNPSCSNNFSVTFRRPNPDAAIRSGLGVDQTSGAVAISNGNATSTVTISKAGQISL